MDSELQTQVNLPVVLINRQGLYVIVAVLGLSILACVCVLAYSFVNYTRLKRDAEEVRRVIGSREKETSDRQSNGKRNATTGGARLPEVKAPLPTPILSTKRDGNKSDVIVGQSDTFALLARQEAVVDAQQLNAVLGRGSGDTSASAVAADAKGVAAVYSITTANVTGHGPTKAV
ncbi:hypothetical protein HPB49_005199 [Dermacentor silvarum]|uniref:Uncharacterized protein n=1 Tax=Dermacentor silvarum TaxID=543639 RepID=A0ACB8DW42_DERSI|nr:hypothetical protein HPB49_005199 [Dermacentor silvarum]